MRMDKWAGDLWRAGHAITFAYPVAPSAAERAAAAAWFNALVPLLPCEDCRGHFAAALAAAPVEPATVSRDALSRWFVDMHNRVNARLGKGAVPYETVAAQYTDSECAAGTTCGASVPPSPTPPLPARPPARLGASGSAAAHPAGVSDGARTAIVVAAVLLAVAAATAGAAVLARKRRARPT